jgi:hypothetical protein
MDIQISDKLARFGRTLGIVGKVLAVVCILGAIASLCFAIMTAFLAEDFALGVITSIGIPLDALTNSGGTIAIQAGESSFSIRLGDFIPPALVTGLKVVVVSAAFASFLYCLVSAIILFVLSAMFKATAIHKTPFLDENVRRLKIIGVVLIVISLPLGLHNLILAFCIFAFAYVVQYGTELQQQADETL